MSNNTNLLQSIHELQSSLNERIADFQRGLVCKSISNVEESFSLLRDFDELTGKLFLLRRTYSKTDPKRLRIEESVAFLSQSLLSLSVNPNKDKHRYDTFTTKYRRIWREESALFFFCAVMLIVSSLVGFQLGIDKPEFLPLFAPQAIQEQIIDHKSWFEMLQGKSIMGFFQIAINNISVAIKCFLAGALLGIGSLIILVFNGLMFGGILGYCAKYGFSGELINFVASHGFLELTIIVASSFAGMLYGRVFFMRPYKLFKERFKRGASLAVIIALGAIPWLLFAAFFETFISPWHFIDTSTKIALGFAVACYFYYWSFKRTD